MARCTRREALLLGIGSLVAPGWASVARAAADELVKYADERTYDVRHRLALDLTGVAAESLELWVPVPQDDAQQTIRDVKTEPRVPLVRDPTGLAQVARLHLAAGPPRRIESASLEVSYRAACRRAVLDREALARCAAREYTKGAAYRFHTRAATKIESADPRIRRIAQQCQGDGRSPVEVARAAYDWVLDNVRYEAGEDFGGAVYCLEHGRGQCGDYSTLWVAICRAAGVPARPVSGFWADRENGWHCWGEFMLPTGQWLSVDPSLGDRGPLQREYHFGSSDNRRVALCKTHDVAIRGVGATPHKADSLQSGAWWWQGRGLAPDRPASESPPDQAPAPERPKPRATYRVVGRPIDRL